MKTLRITRAAIIYTKSFKLYQGGKSENPQELTQVSDWGEQTRPTQRRLEG
ncbi:addiction module toxin RelE [Enterobacter mori]|nr:addiction module toxin RelE [Enterobacter mori]PWG72413.1 addiction module toxin RelE [Enterobacter mori]